MTSAKAQPTSLLWGEVNPFLFFSPSIDNLDTQGWRSSYEYLSKVVEDLRPRIIAETGAWKGEFAITMAGHLKLDDTDGFVISIDTCLGSVEHLVNPRRKSSLKQSSGNCRMMKTFMSNVMASSLQVYVISLQLDSINAALTLQHLGLPLNSVHIDAGHNYSSVFTDIRHWWGLLEPGGIMILGYYIAPSEEKPKQIWSNDRRAVDEHAANSNLVVKHSKGKCWLEKSQQEIFTT